MVLIHPKLCLLGEFLVARDVGLLPKPLSGKPIFFFETVPKVFVNC
jgi:hypothetical protein